MNTFLSDDEVMAFTELNRLSDMEIFEDPEELYQYQDELQEILERIKRILEECEAHLNDFD